MAYITKVIGTKVALSAHITKRGVGVPGLTPTVEIRRNGDGLYFDFSAAVPPFWVVSGGQREMILPAIGWIDGLYQWEFDQSLYDTGVQEYTVLYRNGLPYQLELSETIGFEIDQSTALNMERILQFMQNPQDLKKLSPTAYEHLIFEDGGGALPTDPTIYEADITLDGATEKRRPR